MPMINIDYNNHILNCLNPSPSTLSKICKTSNANEQLQSLAATWNKTPLDLLRFLVKNPYTTVRGHVAQNPNVTPELLEELSQDTEKYVLTSVAKNPLTPPETLKRFAQTQDTQVMFSVMSNPSTPLNVLEDTLQVNTLQGKKQARTHYQTVMLQAIAANPSTTPQMLETLSSCYEADIRETVAANPNTPLETLEKFLQDPGTYVSVEALRTLVALHGWGEKLSFEEINKLHVFAKEALASAPETSTETLVFLSEDPDTGVQMNALENPNMPVETLKKFSVNPQDTIRVSVASNPSTPQGVLRKLYKDREECMLAVLENPSAPPDLLERAVDPTILHLMQTLSGGFSSREWMLPIIVNPSASPEVLQGVAAHLKETPQDVSSTIAALVRRQDTPSNLKILFIDTCLDYHLFKHLPELNIHDLKILLNAVNAHDPDLVEVSALTVVNDPGVSGNNKTLFSQWMEEKHGFKPQVTNLKTNKMSPALPRRQNASLGF